MLIDNKRVHGINFSHGELSQDMQISSAFDGKFAITLTSDSVVPLTLNEGMSPDNKAESYFYLVIWNPLDSGRAPEVMKALWYEFGNLYVERYVTPLTLWPEGSMVANRQVVDQHMSDYIHWYPNYLDALAASALDDKLHYAEMIPGDYVGESTYASPHDTYYQGSKVVAYTRQSEPSRFIGYILSGKQVIGGEETSGFTSDMGSLVPAALKPLDGRGSIVSMNSHWADDYARFKYLRVGVRKYDPDVDPEPAWELGDMNIRVATTGQEWVLPAGLWSFNHINGAMAFWDVNSQDTNFPGFMDNHRYYFSFSQADADHILMPVTPHYKVIGNAPTPPPAPASIRIGPSDASLRYPFELQYVALSIDAYGEYLEDITTEVNWKSSNEAVIDIKSATGWATSHSPGNAIISADWGYGDAFTDETGVNVQENPISIEITPSGLALPWGESFQMECHAIYQNTEPKDITGEVDWLTEDSSRLSISTDGIVEGLYHGPTDITAHWVDHMFFTDTVKVTVDERYIGARIIVAWDHLDNTLIETESLDMLLAPVTPDGAINQQPVDSVVWGLSPPGTNVLSLYVIPDQYDMYATATAENVGSAYVTVDAIFEGVTYTADPLEIDVIPIYSAFTLSQNAVNMVETTTSTVTASAYNALTNDIEDVTTLVVWDVTDDNIATVDGGLITAVHFGNTVINATWDRYGFIETISTVVTPLYNDLDLIGVPESLIEQDTSHSYAEAYDVLAEGYVNVTNIVTWNSDKPAIATVDGGLITAISFGDTSIRVSWDRYPALSDDKPLNVIPFYASLDITPASTDTYLDVQIDYTAWATPTGGGTPVDVTTQVVWDVIDENIATINPTTGHAVCVGTGTTDITAVFEQYSLTASADLLVEETWGELTVSAIADINWPYPGPFTVQIMHKDIPTTLTGDKYSVEVIPPALASVTLQPDELTQYIVPHDGGAGQIIVTHPESGKTANSNFEVNVSDILNTYVTCEKSGGKVGYEKDDFGEIGNQFICFDGHVCEVLAIYVELNEGGPEDRAFVMVLADPPTATNLHLDWDGDLPVQFEPGVPTFYPRDDFVVSVSTNVAIYRLDWSPDNEIPEPDEGSWIFIEDVAWALKEG